MKFAILSLAAAAGLALSGGEALAGPPGHWHGGHGHGHGYGHGNWHPRGGHLDYHNGHYHYHRGGYVSPPLVPAYPSYGYGSGFGGYPSYGYGYGSGFSVGGRGFNLTVGSGYFPSYGYGGYSSPFYGGYGRLW